jgi:glycosyltransferase involved in cell wall biosynthesis
MNDRVVAVVLAYNEEIRLPLTLRILSNFKRKGLISDIVVVNDGSEDLTRLAARSFGVHIVNHGANLGLRQGFVSGAHKVKSLGGTHLLLVDSDLLKFPINSLRQMLRTLEHGACMALPATKERTVAGNTSRTIRFNKRDQFVEILDENAVGPRLILMSTLAPLFNSADPLHKEWLGVFEAKSFRGVSGKVVKWGLAGALNLLISNRVRVPLAPIYFDKGHRRVGERHKRAGLRFVQQVHHSRKYP